MRIGELAALVGVSTRTLRHYHHLGLLPEPGRLANGYREYRLRDAVALARVRRLAELGLSLDEIRDVLADDQGLELRGVLLELDADLARQQAAIAARRERLAALLAEADLHPDSAVSPQMAEVLRGLPTGGSRFAEFDHALLRLIDTGAGQADRAEFANLFRPLTEPEALARGHALYARLDEMAGAEPGDPRIAELADDLAAYIPDELASAMVTSVEDNESSRPVWLEAMSQETSAQTTTMMLWMFAMVIELVGVEIVLRAIGTPAGPRTMILVADAYTILIVLAVIAACITRPHVISADQVRIRYGAFFDLRVPRALIAEVRHVRNYNESGVVKVDDDRLVVAVVSQTNLIIELTGPVTAVRPLGRHARIRSIRLFADDPAAAHNALRSAGNAPQP